MEKKLVSVFDRKAGSYGNPVAVRSLGEAERMFIDLLGDSSTLPGKHPEDFDLVLLGSFDDDRGFLVADNANTILKSGNEVVKND